VNKKGNKSKKPLCQDPPAVGDLKLCPLQSARRLKVVCRRGLLDVIGLGCSTGPASAHSQETCSET
jgi:hypothetical protein